MFFLSLLSLTLVSIPIFITFGGYFAVEHEKILGCGFSCDTPPGGGGGGGSGFLPPSLNPGGQPTGGGDVTGEIFCELSYGITPDGGDYTFNPNQWGNTDGKDGALCIKFGSDNNPSGYATSWSTTWEFLTPGPQNAPVHAFPNAELTSSEMPLQLSALSALTVDVAWAYGMGSDIPTTTDTAALTAGGLTTNVALDIFLSGDEGDSGSTTKADYEVLVWFGRFGDGADPVGYNLGPVVTREANGITFTLYSSTNGLGQRTFTWIAPRPVTEFNGDVSPLVRDLEAYQGPKTTDYLGYVAFGTEAFNANANATFSNPTLELKVQTA